ncbi:hypothetical protein [Enterovibrio norvegicus]|uniref:hypothetical protein n=1 Tax=Enterovibrio norvegicus TaxID=188144 RepID=UPI0024B1688B|nr:hypothetical protein [Enterovibrio norvegicus]
MGMQSIVYVGPKEFKRDTVTGSRQIFPRLKPIEVKDECAAMLLRFDNVFIEQNHLKDFLAREAQREEAMAEEAAKNEALAKAEQVAMDMTVTISGETVDLSKMTGPKVATLVESLDLADLAPKGPQEAMPDYRKRVRDAIREMGESTE